MEKIELSEIYGMNVFNDIVMTERLPKKIYEELRRTIAVSYTHLDVYKRQHLL